MALDGHARFATLQPVSSVLHTGLTFDVESRLGEGCGYEMLPPCDVVRAALCGHHPIHSTPCDKSSIEV